MTRNGAMCRGCRAAGEIYEREGMGSTIRMRSSRKAVDVLQSSALYRTERGEAKGQRLQADSSKSDQFSACGLPARTETETGQVRDARLGIGPPGRGAGDGMMQRFVCLEWMFFYVSKEWKKTTDGVTWRLLPWTLMSYICS